jgi:hypothetical protein
VKPFLVTLTAALVLLGAGVGTASAGTPCWKKVLNDWVDRNGIQGTYPTRCYQEAIRHLPPDIQIYSSAEADLRRAMLLAFHTRDGGPGSGGFGGGAGAVTDSRGLQSSPGSGDARRGALTRAIDWLGPSDASSVPTPLLVLAGIALLLLASAAASFVARRIHARRKPENA